MCLPNRYVGVEQTKTMFAIYIILDYLNNGSKNFKFVKKNLISGENFLFKEKNEAEREKVSASFFRRNLRSRCRAFAFLV